METLPLIVIGGGGHARVVIDAALRSGRRLLGFTDPDASRTEVLGIPRLGGDEALDRHAPDGVRLVNGVGSVRSSEVRLRLYERWVARGYRFDAVVHPSAIVAGDVQFGDGAQVMAGAVVQSGVLLGVNCVINTRASIDHDCRIGDHAHVGPGATLSGAVRVGEGAHVGTGSCVIQGIEIGAWSTVGAGAAVVRAVAARTVVAGVPARLLRRPDSQATANSD